MLQEEIFCDFFMEVFYLLCVGIDDCFFDLGGYFLFVVQFMSCICEVFGVEFSIGNLFEVFIVVGFVERFEMGLS